MKIGEIQELGLLEMKIGAFSLQYADSLLCDGFLSCTIEDNVCALLVFWEKHAHASEDSTLQVGPGARLEAHTVVKSISRR